MHNQLKSDYFFEISWEVCNKVGGIHTVISTKAEELYNIYNDNLIFIGPDNYKDSTNNPEFIEEPNMLVKWKANAWQEGLRIRIGRWNLAKCQPIVVLVDFTSLISQKDQIFTEFWDEYELDSISGQWDYIEPALFGYAAGKIIENYYYYQASANKYILAQFHEWMTGAGVLHLKKHLPQVATAFTTHATIMGRSIAGNGLPLYENMCSFNVKEMANSFNITSKLSLEQLSAKHADVFTTVSEITGNECQHFLNKKVDIVTPNGFNDSFVPEENDFNHKVTVAKQLLKNIAETVTEHTIPDDSLYISTSGRYEFKNKGIDVFIDALSKINTANTVQKQIIAFIMVPAGNYGANKYYQNKLLNNSKNDQGKPQLPITHDLYNADNDPVVKKLYEHNLFNKPEDKVKIIFVPTYLNGNDGIFNLPYYDILIGMDLTVYPSYYEPWGYTPLESIAFKIPTVTTTLAGFGVWMNAMGKARINDAITVIERTDTNDDFVRDEIVKQLTVYSLKTDSEIAEIRERSFHLSKEILWKHLIKNYIEAYQKAEKKMFERHPKQISIKKHQPVNHLLKGFDAPAPVWKKAFVKAEPSQALMPLYELTSNLWWSWDIEATEFFTSIEPELWAKCNYNPIELLENLSYDKLEALKNDTTFINQLNSIHSRFKDYINEKPQNKNNFIAYYCMEYGLHNSIQIYSGGLGILAGDYLKEASDRNANMMAVGLLYRNGYFKQAFTDTGEQIAIYEPQKFSKIPVKPVRNSQGNWIKIAIMLPGRPLYAKVWRVDVGRIPLYLLDTDIEENSNEDRRITHQLYGGDNENRLKQEMLLGLGGVRLLEKLDLYPDIYHINEGHAAFLTIERLRTYIEENNLMLTDALEIVKNSTLFTTHTPVPAGHDAFTEDLMRIYMGHIPEKIGLTWDDFMSFGKSNPHDNNEKFSMSNLAIRLSAHVNGVSKIHGEVSRKMFNHLWPSYFSDELHITHVTNGVHYPTWMAKRWKNLFSEYLGNDFLQKQNNPDVWQKIYNVPDNVLWNVKQAQRKDLISFVRQKIEQSWSKQQINPKTIVKATENMSKNTLTIGFARRFATYKRAHLLFRNLDRLAKIVNNPNNPVQFIFAGKAHPNDKAGQDLIKEIIRISKLPDFLGKIVFLENYDIELAKKMVQGVDIWLNTPTRPLEASGTSGEKVIINGGMHFSVLDGWWAEGYKPNAGWYLKEERTYDNQELQNELDAETIYSIFENNITPAFYNKNNDGISKEWIGYIKNSIALIAPDFNMSRMLHDYFVQHYNVLSKTAKLFKANNYATSKKIAEWKRKVFYNWENIEILSIDTYNSENQPIAVGSSFEAKIKIDLKELSANDVGLELMVIKTPPNEVDKVDILYKIDMDIKSTEGSVNTYTVKLPTNKSGVYNYNFRLYPKHKDLPHRMDFALAKWVQ